MLQGFIHKADVPVLASLALLTALLQVQAAAAHV
jgi:hypothetical protein